MISIPSTSFVGTNLGLSIEEHERELSELHARICAIMKESLNLEEVKLFEITGNYVATTPCGINRVFSFEGENSQLFNRYISYAYSLIAGTESSQLRFKTLSSFSPRFTRNCYLNCLDKVAEVALQKFRGMNIDQDTLSLHSCNEHYISFSASRKSDLPFMATVPVTALDEKELDTLANYNISRYVAKKSASLPKDTPKELLEEVDPLIRNFIEKELPEINVGFEYELLPDSKIKVLTGQETEITVDATEIKDLLVVYQAATFGLAHENNNYRLPSISKELANDWIKKSKEEAESIVYPLVVRHGIQPNQIENYFLTSSGMVRINYIEREKKCFIEEPLSTEENALFSMQEAYQKIVEDKFL